MGRRPFRSCPDADGVHLAPRLGQHLEAAVEATANWVTGPYRLEVIEGAHQPILQAERDKLTKLLVAHLAEHAQLGD